MKNKLLLCLLLVLSACVRPTNVQHAVSHMIIGPIPSLQTVAADSGALASCCSTKGEARCVGAAYCNACTTCEYCAYCNSGGSCGVCATVNKSSSGSSTRYGSSNQSQISFWTDIAISRSILIYIDGEYIGKLDSYFDSGRPRCGQNGTVTVSRAPGTHTYLAKDGTGTFWKGNISFPSSGCTTMSLSD